MTINHTKIWNCHFFYVYLQYGRDYRWHHMALYTNHIDYTLEKEFKRL